MEQAFSKARAAAGQLQAVYHLGDGVSDAAPLRERCPQVILISGNCDFLSVHPKNVLSEIDGVKIFAAHGHEYGVKNGLSAILRAGRNDGAHVVLFGHTHLPCVEMQNGILLVNPGSLTCPNECRKGTFALLSIDNGKANARIFEVG